MYSLNFRWFPCGVNCCYHFVFFWLVFFHFLIDWKNIKEGLIQRLQENMFKSNTCETDFPQRVKGVGDALSVETSGRSYQIVYPTRLCTLLYRVRYQIVYPTRLWTLLNFVPYQIVHHTRLCSLPDCVPYQIVYPTRLCTLPDCVPY